MELFGIEEERFQVNPGGLACFHVLVRGKQATFQVSSERLDLSGTKGLGLIKASLKRKVAYVQSKEMGSVQMDQAQMEKIVKENLPADWRVEGR